MLSLLVRRRIKRLLHDGHTKVEAARRVGVSVRTVKRIANEPDVRHTDDAAERRRRGIGRPSKVRGFERLVLTVLRSDPDMTSVEVLRRARIAGYAGSKSSMYAFVAKLRKKAKKKTARRGPR